MFTLTEQHGARIAARALPQRRMMFRALWEVSRLSGNNPSLNAAPTFERILRLPSRAARTLAREADFNDMLTLLEWATFKFRTLPQLIQDQTLVTVHNEPLLARLAAEGRSIVLAPLHMGAYVFSLATLMHRHLRGRRVLILRNHADDQDDSNIMSRLAELGCDVRFMAIRDKAGFIEALRFARVPGSLVVCFVDLPASYGAPVDIELFGRPARLAMGVDVLARALNATVVPMSSTSHLRSETITIGRPFEVAATDSPDERRRVAELMRRHIESSVLAAPAQWHMWTRLHEFLVTEPGSDTASSTHGDLAA